MEEWKDIKGYEGLYQVSNLGRVKNRHGRILKSIIDRYGYITYGLSKKSIIKYFKSHRLVAIHFISNSDNLPEVNHINGIKTDNRVENLEWCTSSQNQIHAFKIGLQTSHKGEECYNSKLTEKQVLEIRAKYIPKKYTQQNLANEYGVTRSTVQEIISNKIWRHI